MSDYLRPPFLKPGDKVLILSPASRINPTYVKKAMERLESWGLKTELSENALGAFGRYSGTQEDRAKDLQQALDREDVQAILCSRGGYGVVHLLEKISYEGFRKHPKWILGYSDITALHMATLREGFMSLHSLMAKHLQEAPLEDYPVACLKSILYGNMPEKGLSYVAAGHPLNRAGKAQGTLLGGNLCVWNGLRGTPWDFDYSDSILFIEDIGERPHTIERMVWNLRLSGILSKTKGVIIGQMTDMKDEMELGKPLYEALADIILPASAGPVCFGFPVGHVNENLPLVEGARVCLMVSNENTELNFLNLL